MMASWNRCFGALALATLLTTSGCASWSDATEWNLPVWSDDGKQAAVVMHELERKVRPWSLGNAYDKRNFSAQVKIATIATPASKSQFKSLGPVRDGEAEALYYMATQGYVILGRGHERIKTKGSNNESQTLIWERIDMAGKVKQVAKATGLVMISCPPNSSGASSTMWPVEVLPSRDGKTLAVVSATPTCSATAVEVKFLDAATLVQQGSTIKLHPNEFGANAMKSYQGATMDPAWDKSGALVIGSGLGTGMKLWGWKIVPGDAPQKVYDLNIEDYWPETSSSSEHEKNGWISVGSDGVLEIEKENP